MAGDASAFPEISDLLRARAARWRELKRWERRELGQALRRLGLSYREIGQVVPVSKATLSGWCRDLELTDEQRERLWTKRPALHLRREIGRRRRQQALDRAAAIRSAARAEARVLSTDPLWVAGVVAYWAEGQKRPRSELRFANSDPRLIQLFITWARRYLGVGRDRLNAQLHLHTGQDESERTAFWSHVIGIAPTQFTRAHLKREGTGHRKNVLYNGTASIRIRGSSDLFHRVMGWIEGLSEIWAASSTG